MFMGFPKCFHILKGFKAFQSFRNYFKYTEKQIGFSHGNLYDLYLLSNSTPANVAFYTRDEFLSPHRYHFDDRSSSESKEPRFRFLEIEANAVIHVHTCIHTSEYLKKKPASGAGNPGWSRTRPKLVSSVSDSREFSQAVDCN